MHKFISESLEFLEDPKKVYYALCLILFLGFGMLNVDYFWGDLIIRADLFLMIIYPILKTFADEFSRTTRDKK